MKRVSDLQTQRLLDMESYFLSHCDDELRGLYPPQPLSSISLEELDSIGRKESGNDENEELFPDLEFPILIPPSISKFIQDPFPPHCHWVEERKEGEK